MRFIRQNSINIWWLDSRPLSLFRIIFGMVLIKDVIYHFSISEWFYSDNGILPSASYQHITGSILRFSPLETFGDPLLVQALFLVWLCAATCITVGFKTQLATIVNVFIIVAVHERNFLVIDSSDDFLRLFSIWFLFLPTNHHYSLDRIIANKPMSGVVHLIPRTIIALQIVVIYMIAGWSKLYGELWINGTALLHISQLKHITLPTADFAVHFIPTKFFHVATYMVLLIEVILPFILLTFVRPRRILRIGLIFGTLMHLGIGVTLAIANFSLLMIASYILLLPPDLIRSAEQKLDAASNTSSRPNLSLNRIDSIQRIKNFIMTFLFFIGVWHALYPTQSFTNNSLLPMPPDMLEQTIRLTGVWQHWILFAPDPPTYYTWISIPGLFPNDEYVALYVGNTDSQMQRNFWGSGLRQAHYDRSVVISPLASRDLYMAWATYYCRNHQQLISLEINIHYQVTALSTVFSSQPYTHTVWSGACSGQSAIPDNRLEDNSGNGR